MAIYYLKKGKTAEDKAIDDAEVSEVVKNTLKVIEDQGDAAVREFSEKILQMKSSKKPMSIANSKYKY